MPTLPGAYTNCRLRVPKEKAAPEDWESNHPPDRKPGQPWWDYHITTEQQMAERFKAKLGDFRLWHGHCHLMVVHEGLEVPWHEGLSEKEFIEEYFKKGHVDLSVRKIPHTHI